MRECGTSLRNLAEKSLRKQTSERNAEPAEPFPTSFFKARKYMKKIKYSEICRFRRFRSSWQLDGAGEMCGKRFRRFRTPRWPPPDMDGPPRHGRGMAALVAMGAARQHRPNLERHNGAVGACA